jgi:hypothetical protein
MILRGAWREYGVEKSARKARRGYDVEMSARMAWREGMEVVACV